MKGVSLHRVLSDQNPTRQRRHRAWQAESLRRAHERRTYLAGLTERMAAFGIEPKMVAALAVPVRPDERGDP